MREILLNTFAAVLGLLLAFLLLEGVFRLLPVNEGFYRMPVNVDNPILRSKPNRDFTWSSDWRFSVVNEVHTNNDGFVSDLKYVADARSPLMAVIGDSFVEAVQVPWKETAFARLHEDVQPEARVYTFGVGGAPLSQYLALGHYVRGRYNPDRAVVVIVGNDFDQSFYHYNPSPAGFHHFMEKNGELALMRSDFQPGLGRRLIRHSHLAMYLAANLKLPAQLGLLGRAAKPPRHDRTKDKASTRHEERCRLSDMAVDAFLDQLPAALGLPKEHILLVLDGRRAEIYGDVSLYPDSRYFARMRHYFMNRAEKAGYAVLDLHPVFSDAYKQHLRRFDFETDWHWNAWGHETVYRAIADTEFWKEFKGDF